MIDLKEPKAEAYRVARNVGRCDQMRIVVRLHGIFPVYKRDLLTVQPYSEVVGIGDGEFQRAIAIIFRFDAGDDRGLGVRGLHIAAAAELLVGVGPPDAAMRMGDDLHIIGDADAAVDDGAGGNFLIGQALCQAVIERLAPPDGDAGELAAGNADGHILLDEQIGAGAARHGQGAAGFGGDRAVIAAGHELQRSAGLEQDAVFIGAAEGLQAAAIVDGDLTADGAVPRRGSGADGQGAGDLAGVKRQAALAGDGAAHLAAAEDALAHAVDRPGEGGIPRRQLASLGADDVSGDCAAGEGKVRALGHIELFNGKVRCVQGELAGFHGRCAADICEQLQGAAAVGIGLGRSQGLRKGHIALGLAVLFDDRCQVAEALGALVRTLHITRVVAHGNGDGESVGVDRIAVELHPDAVFAGIGGGKVQQAEFHVDGLERDALAGLDDRSVGLFQGDRHLFIGILAHIGGHKAYVFRDIGRGQVDGLVLWLAAGGDHHRGRHNGDFLDPIPCALAGDNLALYILFPGIRAAVGQLKRIAVGQISQRRSLVVAFSADDLFELAALERKAVRSIDHNPAKRAVVAALYGQMAAAADIQHGTVPGRDLGAADTIGNGQITAIAYLDIRDAVSTKEPYGQRFARKIQGVSALRKLEIAIGVFAQAAHVRGVKLEIPQELHGAAGVCLGIVDGAFKGLEIPGNVVHFHGQDQAESAVRAVAVFVQVAVGAGNHRDIFKCLRRLGVRIADALIAVLRRQQIGAGHAILLHEHLLEASAVKLRRLPVIGCDLQGVVLPVIDLQRAFELKDVAYILRIAQALAHDQRSVRALENGLPQKHTAGLGGHDGHRAGIARADKEVSAAQDKPVQIDGEGGGAGRHCIIACGFRERQIAQHGQNHVFTSPTRFVIEGGVEGAAHGGIVAGKAVGRHLYRSGKTAITAGKGLLVDLVLGMAGDIHRQGVARLVGHDHSLLHAGGGPEPELAFAVQALLLAVHGDLVDVLVADLQVGLIAEIIVPAVGHVLDDREGGVQLKALGAGIGHIAGVVGELGIDDILVIAGDRKGLVIFIEDAALHALLVLRLDAEEVLDLHRVLGLVIARLGVAVVLRGDLDGDLLLKEQAEGNGVQQGLPPGAVLDLDLACGGNGVRQIVAVLAVAEGADGLLEVAGLPLVYAAVMGAGVAALGALAVHIGLVGVGLDRASFAIAEAHGEHTGVSIRPPVVFIRDVNILAVFVEQHAAVGENGFHRRRIIRQVLSVALVEVGIGNSVIQRGLRDLQDRLRRRGLALHAELADDGAAEHRKAAIQQEDREGMAPLVAPAAGQRHLLQRHRAAFNFQDFGGVKFDRGIVFAEGIGQRAVFDGDIRRVPHDEQLIGDRAADGLAAEVQGELAVFGTDGVFPIAQVHVAQQPQGGAAGAQGRIPRVSEGLVIYCRAVRLGQYGGVDLPLAIILALAVFANGGVVAGHAALLALSLALNVHDEPVAVLGDIICLGQARLAADVLRRLPLPVEVGVTVRQQILHEAAVFPLDLVELAAGQLGACGLVDSQRADLDALPIGRVLDGQGAVDLTAAEVEGADLALALQGQRSVRNGKVDLAHGSAAQLNGAGAARRHGPRDVLEQSNGIAAPEIAVLQGLHITHSAILVGDLTGVQLAAVVAVAHGFIHGAVLTFHHLKLGKIRLSREAPAIGHQCAGLTRGCTLVVLEGIACLQHVGDGHLAGASKADGGKVTAGELHIFQGLGIGGGQLQFFEKTSLNVHGGLGAGDADTLNTAAVLPHRYDGTVRRLHGDLIHIAVFYGEGGVIPADDDLAGTVHDVVVQIQPDVFRRHIQIRLTQIIPGFQQRNGDLIAPIGLEGIPRLDEGGIEHRARALSAYLRLQLDAADLAPAHGGFHPVMLAQGAAGGALAVFIGVLVVGNDLDVFQRQHVGADQAAVLAVKRAAVAQQRAQCRLLIFAGGHRGFGGDILELAAGEVDLTAGDQKFQGREAAAADIQRTAVYSPRCGFRAVAAVGDVHRAGAQIQLLHRTAGDVGRGVIIPLERKHKTFHRAAGDMHCGGKVLRSQLLHRAAVYGQRTVVHGEQSDAAAAGHGKCTGLVLDDLALLLINADGADIDIINALPVQIQGDIARDSRYIIRTHFDVRLQRDGAAVVLIGVFDRILVDIKGDLAARCNDGRRAVVRTQHLHRQHGNHHHQRQKHGQHSVFQCVCTHFSLLYTHFAIAADSTRGETGFS